MTELVGRRITIFRNSPKSQNPSNFMKIKYQNEIDCLQRNLNYCNNQLKEMENKYNKNSIAKDNKLYCQ